MHRIIATLKQGWRETLLHYSVTDVEWDNWEAIWKKFN